MNRSITGSRSDRRPAEPPAKPPDAPGRPRRGWPLGWWLPALAALLVALGVRHAVVEPAAIAQACDPAPWSGWCAARSALVRTFSTQALGWLALAAGVLATLGTWLAPARAALALGAAGLVLYCYEPSAVGALLGAMALNRAAGRPR